MSRALMLLWQVEGKQWRIVWRARQVASPLYPRVTVAVGVGYLVLAGAGHVEYHLIRVANHGRTALSLGIAVLLLLPFVLAFYEVQRRVGRRFGTAIEGTLYLFAMGIFWALVSFGLHQALHAACSWPWDPSHGAIFAAAALLIGFAGQLFGLSGPLAIRFNLH